MMAMRPSSRPYSTMLAPRSRSRPIRPCSQAVRTRMLIGCAPSMDASKAEEPALGMTRRRLRYRLAIRLVEAAVYARELGRHVVAQRLHGHDGDDRNEGQEQSVLDHAGTPLPVGVELRLEPGLENEQVHGLSSGCC